MKVCPDCGSKLRIRGGLIITINRMRRKKIIAVCSNPDCEASFVYMRARKVNRSVRVFAVA